MEVSPTSSLYFSEKKSEPLKQTLDKDAFLKILVAQMRYQNPFDPQSSEDFIVQMTQMATMEQMYNVATQIEQFVRLQKLYQTVALIGREVTVATGEGKTETGIVNKVVIGDDNIKLVINGNEYDITSVVEIKNFAAPGDSSNTGGQ